MSNHLNTVCEKFAPRAMAPAKHEEIAALAYRFWVARAFRNGSPQEDWLRALRAVYPPHPRG